MKRVLFILISLLIGIGFTLIFLELFLRINPKFGYNYNSFEVKSEDSPMLQVMDRHEGIYRPSLLLGYERVPNYAGTNSYGLIGKEYKLKKDKNTFRILLLGDSIAEQRWSSEFLEDELNNNPQLNLKYKFEIWNAGVGGYDVHHYVLYLQHKGLDYKPDMIIIFLFLNDFCLNTSIYYKTKDGITEYHFPIREISKRYNANSFFMKHSYLYRFVILRLDSYLLSKKKTQGINPVEENGRYYLGIIKRICQRNSLPLFIVIFPYLKPLNEYKDWQMSQYLVICKVIKDLEIIHLNLYNLYGQLLKENLPLTNRYEDDIHPSKEAHSIIAKKISNYILDNFSNLLLIKRMR